MVTWANRQVRLDFSPAARTDSVDSARSRYRCPCRDCAFSLEDEIPARPASSAIGRTSIFERQLDERFA